MTLALTLGMSIGVKKSLHMMWGELIGVGLVGASAGLGVATIMLRFPQVFIALKIIGGLYLIWIGFQMWQSKGSLAIPDQNSVLPVSSKQLDLALNGIITAVANPKGWAFMVSLLPPFINAERDVAPQLLALLSIIMVTEFTSMLAYASGGKSLRIFLSRGDNIRWLNRIAGSLMIGVGVWLAMS